MKQTLKPYGQFHRDVTKIILLVFLYSTCFSGTPGKAEAAGEITYIKSYSYDLNGNIKDRTTPDDDFIQYSYDSLNRLETITYPDLSTVSFVYDANGNRKEMTDYSGTTYYVYDEFNLLSWIQFPGINPIYYEYDKSGNRK